MVYNQYFGYPHWHPLNQQSVRQYHRTPIHHVVKRKRRNRCIIAKRKTNDGCCSSSDGSGVSKRLCYLLIALSLFVVVLVVIAIAILAVYIGTIRSYDGNYLPTRTHIQYSTLVPMYTFFEKPKLPIVTEPFSRDLEIILDGSIRVSHGDHYTVELSNRSSQLFLNKVQLYKQMMEKLFGRSVLSASIKHCVIMGFKNGSLLVFYRLVLDRRKIPSRILANLEETAKRIIFEESTTLKPIAFTNVRVDPKQIIVRRNSGNVNSQYNSNNRTASQLLTDPPPLPYAHSSRLPKETGVDMDNTAQILQSTGGASPVTLRKIGPSSTSATSSFGNLFKKKSLSSSLTTQSQLQPHPHPSWPSSSSSATSKSIKKRTRPSSSSPSMIEKFDRIKLELESPQRVNDIAADYNNGDRANRRSNINNNDNRDDQVSIRRKFPYTSKNTPTTLKNRQQLHHRQSQHTEPKQQRISFVSEDDHNPANVLDVSARNAGKNSTKDRSGIGEVEIILDPSTSSENEDNRRSSDNNNNNVNNGRGVIENNVPIVIGNREEFRTESSMFYEKSDDDINTDKERSTIRRKFADVVNSKVKDNKLSLDRMEYKIVNDKSGNYYGGKIQNENDFQDGSHDNDSNYPTVDIDENAKLIQSDGNNFEYNLKRYVIANDVLTGSTTDKLPDDVIRNSEMKNEEKLPIFDRENDSSNNYNNKKITNKIYSNVNNSDGIGTSNNNIKKYNNLKNRNIDKNIHNADNNGNNLNIVNRDDNKNEDNKFNDYFLKTSPYLNLKFSSTSADNNAILRNVSELITDDYSQSTSSNDNERMATTPINGVIVIDDKTESNLIVLNTEVVTSTSMQISYGDKVLFNGDMGFVNAKDIFNNNKHRNEVTVNSELPKIVEYSASGRDGISPSSQLSSKKSLSNNSIRYKYKTMSPRSLLLADSIAITSLSSLGADKHILNKRSTSYYSNSSNSTNTNNNNNNKREEDERITASFLNEAIERYKKNPSNDTLQIIIQHLATLYTKSTTTTTTTTNPINSIVTSMIVHSNNRRPINYSPQLTSDNKSQADVIDSNRDFVDNNNIEYRTNDRATFDCPINSTYRCANGDCISEHSWCNQLVDCSDGSDEKNCTCADYLRAQFATKKLCDGVVDCWDFSDENSCDWCSPDKYVCSNAKLCVAQNQICDGNRDCPHGDDERNCISIAPSISKQADVTYYTSGFVMVRRAGNWGKLCFNAYKDGESISETLTKMSELGRAVCKTMTFRNFVRISKVPDEESNDVVPQIYYRLTNIAKNSTSYFKRKNFRFVRTNCEQKEVIQVKCANLECGVQTEIGKVRPQGRYRGERHSRIVGGGSAAMGAWPWQAALYKEGEFQCGATLISDKWLLSAGHCFYNALDDYWVARLGILRRGTTLPSPYEQIHPIHRIILHPGYIDAGFINDVSLLEMRNEVQFTNYVRPICLPQAATVLPDGTLCTVIGWGQLMEIGRVFPDTLQEVQLPVISTSECRKRTMFLPLYKVTDNMLCAGFERGGRDACLGDSGGPLMCQDANHNGAWYLHGVTSNGYGCARANRPGVYTKVANYVNWIADIIAGNSRNVNNTKILQDNCNGHRCPLGECLSKIRICNGYMECSDGSDENKCSPP